MEFFGFVVGMVCGLTIGFLFGMLAIGYMNYKNLIKDYGKNKEYGGDMHG